MDAIDGLNSNEPAIVGTAITFTVLASVSAVLRVISKRLTRTPFGMEDWTAFLALIIFVVSEVLVIASTLIGRTAKQQTGDDPAYVTYTRYVFTYSAFYFCVVALCLASILFLYRKLFIRRTIRRITLAMLLILCCWIIQALIIEVFGSVPEVDFPDDPAQHSWKLVYISWWFANGLIEEVMTLAAILIPIFQVSKLHLSLRKRLLLLPVFAVSGLCFITGILRLALLYRPSGAKNEIDIVLGDIILNVHLGTAIMSANLPVCWPVVSHRSEIARFLSWRTKSSTRTATNDTMRMGDLALPRKLSAAHLRDGADALFDPRGATTWTDARRAGSAEDQVEGIDHAAASREDGGIKVTRTVDVRRSA